MSLRFFVFLGKAPNGNVLIERKTIDVAAVSAVNPTTLSIFECLCLLCPKLDIIQRGIDPASHDPVHPSREYHSCRQRSPALFNGLTHPQADAFVRINKLHTSIISYEVVFTSSMQQTYTQNDEEDTSFFIDRKYRRGGLDFRHPEQHPDHHPDHHPIASRCALYAVTRISASTRSLQPHWYLSGGRLSRVLRRRTRGPGESSKPLFLRRLPLVICLLSFSVRADLAEPDFVFDDLNARVDRGG